MLPIKLSAQARRDISRLKKENSKLPTKLWDIILDITDNKPFEGIGKPEALKGNLKGNWSRRITDKHRLIYRIHNEALEIISCYGHYDD